MRGLRPLLYPIFFDGQGRELGVFIERPDAIIALLREWRERFERENPHFGTAGKPIGELEPPAKDALLGYFRIRRAEARPIEKDGILRELRRIITPS